MQTKKSFLFSKGFYIAIILSVLAITCAAYLGINMTMNDLKDQAKNVDPNEITGDKDNEIDEWEYPVDNVLGNVPNNSEVETNKDEEEVPKEQTKKKPTETGFSNPLKGKIINAYSNGEMVKSETLNEWRTHDGVDIAALAATPVKAIGQGTVKDSYTDPMWGFCVIVTHSNNIESHYYGLNSNVLVSKGQKVNLGDVVGSVGNTAEIEANMESHFHFGVKKDNNWVDPASIMTK